MKRVDLITKEDVLALVRPMIAAQVHQAFEVLEKARKKDVIVFDGEPAKDSDNIDVLNLGVRAHNALFNQNVSTIGELCAKKDGDLLRYKNFGKTALFEVKWRLAQAGRQLS